MNRHFKPAEPHSPWDDCLQILFYTLSYCVLWLLFICTISVVIFWNLVVREAFRLVFSIYWSLVVLWIFRWYLMTLRCLVWSPMCIRTHLITLILCCRCVNAWSARAKHSQTTLIQKRWRENARKGLIPRTATTVGLWFWWFFNVNTSFFLIALQHVANIRGVWCTPTQYTGWPKKLAQFFVRLNFTKY